MKKLITILKQETKSLKIQYVVQIETWAKKQYIKNIERRNNYYSKTCSDFITKSEYYKESKWVHNSPYWTFTEEFVDRSIEKAKQHYEYSIEKLALRIEKKELNENKLKVVTSHIGVNINTTITDGDKTVNAFTILAYGEVQKPHYRYLIK